MPSHAVVSNSGAQQVGRDDPSLAGDPDRVAVVVIANAGHALIREQLVSVLAAWMKRVPG